MGEEVAGGGGGGLHRAVFGQRDTEVAIAKHFVGEKHERLVGERWVADGRAYALVVLA